MGLFSNLFGQAKELTKLANATANIKRMLDEYENDPDYSYIVVATWICKVGVIDMIEKNGWSPRYFAFVPINGHQTKMTMMEIQMATTYRLRIKISKLSDRDLASKLEEALDGGDAFYELDRQIPHNIRDIIENV